MKNLLQKHKNRITPKDSISTLNLTVSGWPIEGSQEETPETLVVYTQSASSEISRALVELCPLTTESRAVGSASLWANFNGLSREYGDIQDAMAAVAIHRLDKVTANMGRIMVARNGRVFVYMDPATNAKYKLDETFLKECYPADGNYAELTENKEYTPAEVADIEVKVYECFDFSPSQLRKETYTAFKVTEGTVKEVTEAAIAKGREMIYAAHDIASDGATTIIRKRGLLAYKEAVKMFARGSQIYTSTTVFALIKTMALIIDKDFFSGVDGAGLTSTDLRDRGLQEFYGTESGKAIKFLAKQLAGQISQARPAATKMGFEWSEPELIMAFLYRVAVIRLRREDITPEIQADLEECFFDTKNSKYAPVDLVCDNGQIFKRTVVNGQTKHVPYTIEDGNLLQEVLESFAGNGRFLVDNGVLHLTYAFMIGDMDQECPDYIADLNGFKAPIYFNRQQRFLILDESKENQEEANLSMQMLSTLLLKKESVTELGDVMIDVINRDWEAFKQDASIAPTVESMKSFYLGNYMQTAGKHFVYNHDASAFRTVCNQFLNTHNRRMERFALRVDHSTFARLGGEWEKYILGQRIFSDEECFCPDVNNTYARIEADLIDGIVEYQKANSESFAGIITVSAKALRAAKNFKELDKNIKDEILNKMILKYFSTKASHTVIIFRSPKMAFGEFARLRAVPLAEVCDRIDATDAPEWIKTAEKNRFKNMKEGSFVLPASERLKELLGGADFDFDGVTVVCNQRFIQMMEGIKSTAISVKKGSAQVEDKYVACSFEDAFAVFIKQTFNGNKSIGEITNMNQLLQLLLFVEDKHVKWLFQQCFKNDGRNPVKYASPINHAAELIEITPELTDEIVARIGYAAMTTREELNSIIIDLNVVFRGFQERTIDAAKTADVIGIAFNLSRFATVMSLSDTIECTIAWGNDSDKDTKVVKKYNEKGTKRISLPATINNKEQEFLKINDKFHAIQKSCCDRLAEIAAEMVAHEAAIQLSAEQGAYIERIGAKYGDKFLKSMVDIMYRYNEAEGMRNSIMASLSTDDDKVRKFYRKTIFPEVSKHYNMVREALKNMIRTMFEKYDNVEVAAFLKYVSCGTTDDSTGKIVVDLKKKSSACHMLLPEEYALLVARLDNSTITQAKSRLCIGKKYNDGEQIEFIRGVSQNEDGRPQCLTSKDINGLFTIESGDNGMYVVDDVANYVDLSVPEKKQLVLRLTLPKGSDYTLLNRRLMAHMNKQMLVTAFDGGRASTDSLFFIEDEVRYTCCKYMAQQGTSMFGLMYNGFQGDLTSVNYYVGTDKHGNKYPTLLVVLTEASDPIKYRVATRDELKARSDKEQREQKEHIAAIVAGIRGMAKAKTSTPKTASNKSKQPSKTAEEALREMLGTPAPKAAPVSTPAPTTGSESFSVGKTASDNAKEALKASLASGSIMKLNFK
jgi:hypothetical protein